MKVFKLMGKLKKYIFVMIIFSFSQVFCELYLPTLMSKIIDTGIGSGDVSFITREAIVMLITTVICLVSHVLVVYSTAKFSNKLGYKIRKELYTKINSFSKREIDKFGASTLITRSTNNVSNITSTFSFGLRLIVFAPIMGIGAAIMGYKTAPTLAPIVMYAVIILLICLITIFILVFPKFEVLQRLLDKLNASSREILSGLRVIKAFNKQDYFKKRFDKVNKENMKLNIFLNKILYLIQPLMVLIIDIATIIIIYVSIDYIKVGSVEIGAMMAFIQYMATVLMSFSMLLVIILNIPRVVVSFKRINEVLDEKLSIEDGNGVTKTDLVGTVEFKNVSFKYPDADEYLLENISFKVEKGETIAFIGSTGSGKSSLINLVPRFYDATDGEILIDGINVKDYTLEELHNKLGYVPQKAVMFTGTVKSNVSYGDNGKKHSVDKIKEAIKVAQANDFVLKLDKTYDSHIARGGTNVSGGQKQRLAIARAIYKDPEIYIFDDSFSALDYKTDYILRKELKKYTKDATSMIVAQRIGTIMHADKIVVLDKGKCVGIGTHKELLKKCKVYKEIALSQFREEEL